MVINVCFSLLLYIMRINELLIRYDIEIIILIILAILVFGRKRLDDKIIKERK